MPTVVLNCKTFYPAFQRRNSSRYLRASLHPPDDEEFVVFDKPIAEGL
jgi:hypothetical protein